MSDKIAVLAMSPTQWDGPWMNRQQLLSRLAAKGHHIVYSTGQWFTWDRGKEDWKNAKITGGFVEKNGVLVDYAAKVLLRWPRYSVVDRYSISLAATRLRSALHIDDSQLILHIFHPNYLVYAKHFSSAKLIYHAYDLFELVPGFTDDQIKQENTLIQKADLCIASSAAIAQRLTARTGREVRVLPNGADTDAFYQAVQRQTIADELAVIPHPRIGYVGRINCKIDLGLISQLAQNKPEWNVVMVGPVTSLDDETQKAWQTCQSLPNVYFLGEKIHTQLPSYVAGLDVALMPYRMDAGLWTEAIYPLKIHEYLAADRPIVSSPLASVKPFSAVIAQARSVEKWQSEIQSALLDGGNVEPGARVNVARANNWNVRVEQLDKWYQGLAMEMTLPHTA